MGAPAAELEIQHQVPTARNTRDASTYTNSTMKLVNTGTVAITGMSMDLQPGATVLPDLVFDPTDGTPAGDVVTKPFTVNSAPSGMAASASYGAPQQDGYRRMDVALSGLAPGGTMAFSVDVDPTSIKGSPLTAEGGPVSGAEMAGALVTVRFADGTELKTRLAPVPNTGTDIPNGVTNARAVLPAPAVRPALARLGGGPAAAVVTNLAQQVVVSGPPGATGKVVSAEAHTSLADVPGGGFQVSPFEPNMLFRGHPPVPFTIGAGGTATVTVNLTRDVTTTAEQRGINVVTAFLESGGKPGPMSEPLLLQMAPPAAGSVSLYDPPGSAPGSYARRIGGTNNLSQSLPLTVSAWFKAPADGVKRPIAQHGQNGLHIDGNPVPKRGWTLERRNDQKLGWYLNSDDPGFYVMFDPVVPADAWVFVAIVATTAGTTLHTWDEQNGWRTQSKGPISPYISPEPQDYLSVGSSKGAPGAEFTGQIDDVRVWSAARSQAAVRSDAATRLSGSEPGLAGYWPFDDGAGHVVADLAPPTPPGGPNTLFLTGDAGTFPFDATGDWSPDTPIVAPERAGAPALVGRLPFPGATDVARSNPLAVRFSEPMRAGTVSDAIGLAVAHGGPSVPVAVVGGSGATTFTVVPASPLSPGTAYELTVGTGAADLGGTPLGAPTSWRFTTVPDGPVLEAGPMVMGTARVGETLTCAPGAWTGSPSFAFRWFADGLQIPGATGPVGELSAQTCPPELEAITPQLTAVPA